MSLLITFCIEIIFILFECLITAFSVHSNLEWFEHIKVCILLRSIQMDSFLAYVINKVKKSVRFCIILQIKIFQRNYLENKNDH